MIPALATTIVAYAGIVGERAAPVTAQVAAALEVTATPTSEADRGALLAGGDDARVIVRRLDADAVIVGALDGRSLRLVVFDGDGVMIDSVAMRVDGGRLDDGAIAFVHDTIGPELAALEDAGADDIDAEIAAQGADLDDDDAPAPLRLRASAGLSLVGRSFAGPSSIASYSSVPVAGARIAAEVVPEPHVALTVFGEHTVAMSTMVHGAATSTEIEHWQARGALCEPMVGFDLGALLGVGRRTFRMDSHDPGRSPDGDYAYALVGGRIGATVGDRVTLHGLAAFEPVIAGDEPTMATFGPARRWALEVGGDIEVAATSHLYIDGAAGYQRFVWSWDMAGARAAGGAVDQYPSASLSVGARY